MYNGHVDKFRERRTVQEAKAYEFQRPSNTEVVVELHILKRWTSESAR
jgi:hypothetical protein